MEERVGFPSGTCSYVIVAIIIDTFFLLKSFFRFVIFAILSGMPNHMVLVKVISHKQHWRLINYAETSAPIRKTCVFGAITGRL